MARRTYNSQYRDAQASQTRTLILEALAELVAEEGFEGIVMRDVAARAGLAERTVYRHFPDRDALHEALAELVGERAGWAPTDQDRFEDLGQLPAMIETAYREFDEEPVHSTVYARIGAIRGRSAKDTSRRTELFRALLAEQRPDLSADEITALLAVIRVLGSSRTWLWLREELDLDGAHSGPVMRWVLELVLDDINARGGLPNFAATSPAGEAGRRPG